MIIVKLIGGLGNQLFQYAVARHLAEIHDTELKLDISGFETYTLHKYSLWALNVHEKFATPNEIKSLKILGYPIIKRIIRRALHKSAVSAPSYIMESREFCFAPDILHLPDNVYLDGNWQSWKYFINIGDLIREEFTVKTTQQGKDKELADYISSCHSVSVHIRRKDYVSDPQAYQLLGTCSLNYYDKSVRQLTESVANPHFFVFSDDPEWACDNLKLEHPTTFVSHNGPDKNYEDFRLMSQCHHHIVANSTFSWWSAWLGQCPNKLVFVPSQWFRSDYDTTFNDLFPEGWIKI
ncbi:MAG: alpha-1,2-fucosyltransferase [bacterium]|nr:alpha-1,2-fucosyltransferase [bacterium]